MRRRVITSQIVTQQKWYLHNAIDPLYSLPLNPTSSQSAATPTDGLISLSAIKTADTVKGTSQQSAVKASVNSTSAQKVVFGSIFVVQDYLSAQTFGSGNWTISGAISESNSNANFGWSACIYVWRPSDGTLVGRILDAANAGTLIGTALTATGQTLKSSTTLAGSNVTCLVNDILVFEFWVIATQSMGTSYNDTIFYDGTTEASTTNCATFVSAPSNVSFARSSSVDTVDYSNQAVKRSAFYMSKVRRSWKRERSGLLVPEYA